MRRTLLLALVAIIVVASPCFPMIAAERSAVELYPATTLFYLESADPPEILDAILNHPLRQRITSLDAYQRAKDNPDFQQLLALVSLIEARVGMGWHETINALTDGGIYVGVDAKTEGVMLMLKARDEPTLAKIRDALITLAREDARGRGRGDAAQTTAYRGQRADTVGQVTYATLGRCLLVTDKDALARQIVDNWLDDARNTLAHNPRFQTARQMGRGQPSVWVFLDIAALRDADVARELFHTPTSSPVIELLVGGLLCNLRETPFATGWLELKQQYARLVLSTPHRWSWIPEQRQYFFGPDGKGVAPQGGIPPHTLLAISAYRDVSRMWHHAADLFDEVTNDELTKANERFSTMFSGHDLAGDFLGAVGPEIQVFVTHQDFGPTVPRPAIPLPAVAIRLRLTEPGAMQSELKKTFQTLIAFYNIMGIQNGQPQLAIHDESMDGRQILTATFVPESRDQPSHQASIHFNMSPTIVFDGDHFLLATSKRLALDLADLATRSGGTVAQISGHTWAKADMRSVRQTLSDNRGRLVAQTTGRDGLSQLQAAERLDTLLAILDIIRDLSVRLSATDEVLELSAQIGLADPL